MGGEEALVVGRAAEGLFANGLGGVSMDGIDVALGGLTGSKVGLWAVVMAIPFPSC